jgi:hypothetical protein
MPSWSTWFPARRRALPEAVVAVVVVRLALAVVPIAAWRKLSDRLRRRVDQAAQRRRSPKDVAWAIRRVSRAVPRATCLTQAVAAQLVLARHGYQSQLRIGVARTSNDGLRAHAWLESDGLIVVGGRVDDSLTPLYTSAVIW